MLLDSYAHLCTSHYMDDSLFPRPKMAELENVLQTLSEAFKPFGLIIAVQKFKITACLTI